MSYVTLNTANGIATIEFYTEQSNALPSQILSDLALKITKAGNDPNAKVILLKSGGNRTFCAGASFDELMMVKTAEHGHSFFMGFANVINAMRKAPKFVLGRVQGKAVGGGVGLIASTDYCVATKYAAVKLSELSIGIGPFIIALPLMRKIGVAALSTAALDATSFKNAFWAKEKGLYSEVFDSVEAMDEEVDRLAKNLASYNPEAMAKMKKVLWENTDDWDELLASRAEVSGELATSTFTRTFFKQFNRL